MQIVTAGTVAGAITIVAVTVSCSAPATRLPIGAWVDSGRTWRNNRRASGADSIVIAIAPGGPLVRVVSKIFAAIVMGHVGSLVIGIPILLVVVPALASGPNPSLVLGQGVSNDYHSEILIADIAQHQRSQNR